MLAPFKLPVVQRSPALSMESPSDTIGPLLIGGLFALVLWGITCCQTYTYFMHSFKDPWHMKLLITFLCLLDTFDSALDVHILYYYVVTCYLNPFALAVPIWSIKVHVATTSISNFVIRSVFIEKIFFLSERSILWSAWPFATSLADLVVGLVITAKVFDIKTFLETSTLSSLFYLNFALANGSDVSIAATMCFFLRRSRTGFEETDSMIYMLLTYTMNTGVIVAIDALLAFIMYILMPDHLIFLAFYILSSKLYLNSYLATLNARARLRSKKEEIASVRHSQISDCRYAVDAANQSSSPTVEKGNNGMFGGTSRISVSITAHDGTDDGLGSSTNVYPDGPSYAV